MRNRRRGTESLPTVEDRFWAKVNKDGPIPQHAPEIGPCWVWTGDIRNGYGSFQVSGPTPRKRHYAHRLAYAWEYGEVPEGTFVMHRCDNPPCVRASHLRTGSEADNREDMYQKGRAWWQVRRAGRIAASPLP